MKFRILSACALVCALAAGAAAQEAAKQAEVKVSGGERDAAAKVQKAKGIEARLQAAAAFVKKYPQSPLRKQMAEALASEVAATTDAQTSLSLAQTYADIFNLPDEQRQVSATLLSGYINTGQVEEAMKAGAAWLAQHPDDIATMQNLAILASAEAINKKNPAYVAQGRQYAAKGIELIEADKIPQGYDAARWPEFKQKTLVGLYREAGVLAHITGDNRAALPLLEKAVLLNTPDPNIYFVVAQLVNEIYETSAKEYQVAAPAERAAAMKKAEAALDRVIEAYARAVAVSDGKPELARANAFFREGLESYYKYRHKNSTDGLQQFIDKYKKPAQ